MKNTDGTPYCPDQDNSTAKRTLHPCYVWSSKAGSAAHCVGSTIYSVYGLLSGKWAGGGFCAVTRTDGSTYFGSVRCRFGFRTK